MHTGFSGNTHPSILITTLIRRSLSATFRSGRRAGVHRPLLGDVLVIGPVDAGYPPLARVQLDLCGLTRAQHHRLAARWSGGTYTVDLPLKARPDAAALRVEVDRWEGEAAAHDARGEAVQARDCVAYAERARRWLAQLDEVPAGPTYSLAFSVHRMGGAVWVTCGGEPYSRLQEELRRHFPAHLLVVSPLAGDMQVGYLLTSDRYGLGLYQEEPSLLARGCLEILTDAIADRIAEHVKD